MAESVIKKLQEESIVDNRNLKLLDVLKEALTINLYPRIDITVGFLFISGLMQMRDELEQYFENGGEMRIVIGNTMQEKTYEQLVFAYNSIERVKKIRTQNMFSNDDKIEPNAEAYRRQMGQLEHTRENEENTLILKKWLESGRLKLRVYTQEYMHAKTYIFHAERGISFGLVGSSNLSLSGLIGNTELEAPVTMGHYKTLSNWFEEIWDNAEDFAPTLIEVIRNSWADPEYLPPPYEVFIRGLYELFRDIIDADVHGMYITTLFSKLYQFQIDAAKRAISISRIYGGVLISDVVGLGKTYIACATAHDLSMRNLYSGKLNRIAVICPKNLITYWTNMIASFNLEGKVFSSGLLSVDDDRSENRKDMIDFVREKAGIVIIDEAHKYTNPDANNYKTLKKILVGKQAIMLTATPYRRNYGDIINIIQLFIHHPKPPFQVTVKSWTELTKKVQEGEIPPSYVLREIMVRRTRYDIIRLYGGKGNCIDFGDRTLCFPERKLQTFTYSISDVYDLDSIPSIVERLTNGKRKVSDVYELLVEGIKDMTYARFNLYSYVLPAYKRVRPYSELSQAGNLKGITKMLFLKRLESSWYAFYRTVERALVISKNFINFVNRGVIPAGGDFEDELLNLQEGSPRELTPAEIDEKISRTDIRYDANNFDLERLLKDIQKDISVLETLFELVKPLKEKFEEDLKEDKKFSKLLYLLNELMKKKDQKVIVFSEYSETVEWIFKALEKLEYVDKWRIASITSKTRNINEYVRRFAPKANGYATDDPLNILIATDVLSEGLNLQDANVVINYDLHWTPVKLIQRIGRVDRIGSEHEKVHLFNFFPETKLDTKLGLLEKVRERVKEFGSALGSDGKILEECEEWSPSAIEAIYGGDAKIIDEFEESTSLAIAEGAEIVLRRYIEDHPDEFEKIKKQYSMRSICYWDGDHPLAFFVCTNSVKTNYYIFKYEGGRWKLSLEKNLEILLRDTNLKIDTPLAELIGDLYYPAAEEALEAFKKMVEETGSDVEVGVGRGRRGRGGRNIDRLYSIFSKSSGGEREELGGLWDLSRWGVRNVQPFDRDFKQIDVESDEKFVEAIKILIREYNIPEMMSSYNKRLKEMGEKALKPHIVAGLLFLPLHPVVKS